ncbi:MAG: DUF1499 domain-containing protein [Sedimenticola sp.]|nr:DUF1499 domain-containing protein [Sedimenticola sp.]
MKTVILIIAGLAVAALVGFMVLGILSRSGEPIGLVEGKLAPCPEKPNCVCSEFDDLAHFTQPITFSSSSIEELLPVLKAIIQDMDGALVIEDDYYLAATFSSALFGFVDDLEIRIDETKRTLHVRSASRVGYSDAGVNGKRVEQFRSTLNATLSAKE